MRFVSLAHASLLRPNAGLNEENCEQHAQFVDAMQPSGCTVACDRTIFVLLNFAPRHFQTKASGMGRLQQGRPVSSSGSALSDKILCRPFFRRPDRFNHANVGGGRALAMAPTSPRTRKLFTVPQTRAGCAAAVSSLRCCVWPCVNETQHPCSNSARHFASRLE